MKINWNRNPVHQLWGKIGVMDATVSSLQKLSFDGGGYAKTKTWVGTIGQTFIPSKTFVIDTTFGYSLLDQYGWGPDYGTNYGLQLGVPGTNGPDIRQSGMPVWGNGMSAQGSTDSWNPYTRFDPSYTANANITKLAGKHTLRFGAAIDRQAMNHWQPEFGGTGPRGRLDFSGNLAGLRGGRRRRTSTTSTRPSCSASPPRWQKAIQWEDMKTREWRHGFHFGDRWQPHQDVTLDLGVRYEYFPLVTRGDGRGVERLDVTTMQVLLGGVGDVPINVGLKTRKTDFAPRLGVAWRLNDLTVVRSGYGLTYNPLPFARPLRGAYPLTIHNTYVSLNSWQPYGTLRAGHSRVQRPWARRGRDAAADDRDHAHARSGQRAPGLHPVLERGLRAPAPVRHVGQRRLCRHQNDARLRQHRTECLAAGRRRAGPGVRAAIRPHRFDDALRRLEQGPVSFPAVDAESPVQERPAAARFLHAWGKRST